MVTLKFLGVLNIGLFVAATLLLGQVFLVRMPRRQLKWRGAIAGIMYVILLVNCGIIYWTWR